MTISKPQIQIRGLIRGATELGKATIAAAAGFFLAVVMITAYLSLTGQLNLSSSPIEYTADIIPAASVPVCAGSVLSFRPSYKSLYAPARVPLYSQIRNIATGDKIKLDTDGLPIDSYFVIAEDVGQVKSEPVTFTLPANTPAGSYAWIGYAQVANKLPVSIRAVFTVKACP